MTTNDVAEPEQLVSDVVLAVTDRAVEKVLEIRSAEEAPETLGLRVEVTGHVGVEYQYDLSFEALHAVPAGDSVVDQGGLPVIVPAGSILALSGATLDLPTSQGQSGLVIRNPNRHSTAPSPRTSARCSRSRSTRRWRATAGSPPSSASTRSRATYT